MSLVRPLVIALVLATLRPAGGLAQPIPTGSRPVPADGGERHLAAVRQLTFGGENAEAYFSANGDYLTFQGRVDPSGCDQQYVVRVADGGGLTRVSPGGGKTTCGFFYGDDRRVLFGSTHGNARGCPAPPDKSRGYVWKLDRYDVFTANRDGSDVKRLTDYGTYTAEAVVSPDGRRVVFTSLKGGDLDIYAMNADGSGQRQITRLGGANFGPSWTADGRRIIFSSNHRQPRSGNFDLFLVNPDGTGLEQVTTSGTFDGFPMFSRDGRRLVWASNRGAAQPGETNLFVAEWRD